MTTEVEPSPIIRLESKETLQRGKPLRLDVVQGEVQSPPGCARSTRILKSAPASPGSMT